MAFSLIWSPTAKLDLWDILSYISESNPSAANRFGTAVFESIERLRDFPQSGRIVPEMDDDAIREIIVSPCRVIYRLNQHDHMVEIARIWHAARGTPEI
jgi:toxin ParE1/3/4